MTSIVPCLVTVRSASKRLPNKCFLPFGDCSVLEHVIKRCIHYNLDPIVCTTYNPEDDQIAELASRLKVHCYRGPAENKLLRWHQCCEHFALDAFHSVDADDPFFCGHEVKKSFTLLKSGFDMVAPSPSSSAGAATVGYSLTAAVVSRACEFTTESDDTEMMWTYIEKLSGLKKIYLDEPSTDVLTCRMTLDYWEDYIMLEALRLLVGNLASRSDISQILKNNPDLQRINSFRTHEWKQNQLSKSSKTGTFS